MLANQMYDRINYGAGYGYGGHSPYANLSTIQHGITSNSQKIEDQADCTRELLSSNIQNIAQNFENLTRAGEFTRVIDGQFQAELRTADRLAAIAKEIADNAKAAAACCCENKLLITQTELRLTAEIKAVETRNIQRDLDTAQRELQTQKILTSCGCGCGGGVRPCPPA